MAIKIADRDGAWEIDLPLSEYAEEAIQLQLDRVSANETAYQETIRRIGERFAEALVGAVTPDLRPPSEAQVKFAIDVAAVLAVDLPNEALKYRGSMKEFLDRFKAPFYERLAARKAANAG